MTSEKPLSAADEYAAQFNERVKGAYAKYQTKLDQETQFNKVTPLHKGPIKIEFENPKNPEIAELEMRLGFAKAYEHRLSQTLLILLKDKYGFSEDDVWCFWEDLIDDVLIKEIEKREASG